MGRNIALEDDDRKKFKELLDELDWNQTQLATESGVERHWVNQILLGSRGAKRANSDLVEKVATRLVKAVKESQDLTPERQQASMTFLGRFSAAVTPPPRVYPPGDAVPLDAVHYITRLDDSILFEGALQHETFSALVTGPVQCGKSSLLSRLEHKAKSIGFDAVRFDPVSAVPGLSVPAQSAAELGAAIASALADVLAREWRLEPASDFAINGIDRLAMWLKHALSNSPKKPRLLIIDDISDCGAASPLLLRLFIRDLHNQRKVGIAIGSTTHFDEQFLQRWIEASSVVAWSPRIELGWFTQDEVHTLRPFFQDRPAQAEKVYDLIQGQPYLTHAALMDPSFCRALEEWNRREESRRGSEESARPVRGAHAYRRYLAAIRRSLSGANVLGAARSTDFQRYLREIAAAKNTGSLDLPRDLSAYLKKAKLFNNSNKLAPPLHKLVFEDLAEVS